MRDQITFDNFHVLYQFSFTSQQLLNSWMDKRMTGFRLIWYLQDNNGSRLAVMNPAPETDWKLADDKGKEQNPYLLRMVQLANQARITGMTREKILEIAVQDQSKIVLSGAFKFSSMCSNNQLKL